MSRLRDMILDGVLPPGDWIAEMKLCNDLAISRTPLREALKVLASENLVTLLPNRGAIVTDIRVDEIVELFEIMGALEGLIGRLAVARATDDDIETLGAMHRAMVAHHHEGNRPAYFDLNQAIHQRIADLSGNQSLASAYAGFAGKIKRARYLANLSDARWAESVREHDASWPRLPAATPSSSPAFCKTTRITQARSSAADCASAPRSALQSNEGV